MKIKYSFYKLIFIFTSGIKKCANVKNVNGFSHNGYNGAQIYI